MRAGRRGWPGWLACLPWRILRGLVSVSVLRGFSDEFPAFVPVRGVCGREASMTRTQQRWKAIAVAVVLLAAARGAAAWWSSRPAVAYQTETVARTDIESDRKSTRLNSSH